MAFGKGRSPSVQAWLLLHQHRRNLFQYLPVFLNKGQWLEPKDLDGTSLSCAMGSGPCVQL